MAKSKVKVIQVLSTADGLHRVQANNAATAYTTALETLDGNPLTVAQAKKLKPNEFRKKRALSGDLLTITLQTKTEYKVGQEITVSY